MVKTPGLPGLEDRTGGEIRGRPWGELAAARGNSGGRLRGQIPRPRTYGSTSRRRSLLRELQVDADGLRGRADRVRARASRAGEGIELSVCAPSKTERPSDRIKTDQRAAVRLAKLLAASELVLVTFRWSSVNSCAIWSAAARTSAPTSSAPGIGSGTSCCAARSTGNTREAWTRKHRSWLTSIKFADHASRKLADMADYLHAHDVLISRRDRVEADLAQLALTAPCAHTVARFTACAYPHPQALGLCAEIGEWGTL